MKTAVHTVRTQISLSPELKSLIEKEGKELKESLSQYLRRAAILRLALTEIDDTNLKDLRAMVIGSVSKDESGWKKTENISDWQRNRRKEEDGHRN